MWLDTPRSLLINIWEFSKYRATTRYIAWHDLARAPPIYHDVVLTGGDEPNDKSLMGGMSANENGNAVSDVENFTRFRFERRANAERTSSLEKFA